MVGRGGHLWRKEEEPLVLWLTYEKAGEKQLRALGSISLHVSERVYVYVLQGGLVGSVPPRETRCWRGDKLGWALGVNMIYVIRLINRLSELRKTFEGGERWFQTWYYRVPFCLEAGAQDRRKIFGYWSSQVRQPSILMFDFILGSRYESIRMQKTSHREERCVFLRITSRENTRKMARSISTIVMNRSRTRSVNWIISRSRWKDPGRYLIIIRKFHYPANTMVANHG